jgi:hypothetical protein
MNLELRSVTTETTTTSLKSTQKHSSVPILLDASAHVLPVKRAAIALMINPSLLTLPDAIPTMAISLPLVVWISGFNANTAIVVTAVLKPPVLRIWQIVPRPVLITPTVTGQAGWALFWAVGCFLLPIMRVSLWNSTGMLDAML